MNHLPEHADLAGAVPAPAHPELPADRQRLLRGHLMNEIRTTPVAARRPRRRLGWVAVPALAGGLALTVVLTTGGGTTVSAAELLDKAAKAAASKPLGEVKDNQYVYIKSQVAFSGFPAGAGGSGTPTVEPLHQREIWLSVDGKKEALLIEEGRPASDAGTKVPEEERKKVEQARRDFKGSLNSPTYDYLAGLPTDPDVLLKKIYDETKGMGQTPDQEAFVTIGDALREQIAPSAVSAALYRAAAKIPGVTVVDKASDGNGKPALAVAHVTNGIRTEWIFDKNTYEFLGERDVQNGTVFGQAWVLQRAIVDKAGDRP